ncbi:MAG: 23S rRNA (pseudouridine(1915)-N(3))-methyltransferase RlmH [Lachnospiraceae bacterium]|nr:23S rRNA (pseudouridine(1915)-N(3))-methyltransferase RlmH [Lachnospiraceae bacterium]
MRITILCVGKIKEKYFTDAAAEYVKRIGRYHKIEVVEVVDEKTPDGAGEAINRQIMVREGERILGKIKEDSYVVALAIEGKEFSSVDLAKKLETLAVNGDSHVTFVIGGSLGLTEKVKTRADFLLSFSRMTFPHQLMRVVLLEQIYRCCKISAREPYHK